MNSRFGTTSLFRRTHRARSPGALHQRLRRSRAATPMPFARELRGRNPGLVYRPSICASVVSVVPVRKAGSCGVRPAGARRCEVAAKHRCWPSQEKTRNPTVPVVRPGNANKHVRRIMAQAACNDPSGCLTLAHPRSRPGQQSCHISVNGIRQRHSGDEGNVLFPRLNE